MLARCFRSSGTATILIYARQHCIAGILQISLFTAPIATYLSNWHELTFLLLNLSCHRPSMPRPNSRAHSVVRKRARHGPVDQGYNHSNPQSPILTPRASRSLAGKRTVLAAYSRQPLLQTPFRAQMLSACLKSSALVNPAE